MQMGREGFSAAAIGMLWFELTTQLEALKQAHPCNLVFYSVKWETVWDKVS